MTKAIRTLSRVSGNICLLRSKSRARIEGCIVAKIVHLSCRYEPGSTVTSFQTPFPLSLERWIPKTDQKSLDVGEIEPHELLRPFVQKTGGNDCVIVHSPSG
jgi:hypothetical protein